MTPSTRTGGRELSRFVEAVRHEYWRRPAFDEFAGGMRQTNTSRVVACQVLEGLPQTRRAAIVADIHHLDRMDLLSDPSEVFDTAATPTEILFDLVCEVCWQELACDLAIRVEDEVRSILSEA